MSQHIDSVVSTPPTLSSSPTTVPLKIRQSREIPIPLHSSSSPPPTPPPRDAELVAMPPPGSTEAQDEKTVPMSATGNLRQGKIVKNDPIFIPKIPAHQLGHHPPSQPLGARRGPRGKVRRRVRQHPGLARPGARPRRGRLAVHDRPQRVGLGRDPQRRRRGGRLRRRERHVAAGVAARAAAHRGPDGRRPSGSTTWATSSTPRATSSATSTRRRWPRPCSRCCRRRRRHRRRNTRPTRRRLILLPARLRLLILALVVKGHKPLLRHQAHQRST